MSKKTQACAHRYKRYVLQNSNIVYKCLRCPHLLYYPSMLIGRKANCPKCGQDFTVQPTHLVLSGYQSIEGGSSLSQDKDWKGWRALIICGDCDDVIATNSDTAALEKATIEKAIRSESEQDTAMVGLLERAYKS